MSDHLDSNWYREYLAKRGEKDGDAKTTRAKKEWDEALTELTPEEKKQREKEADDRDFVYLESPKEVFSVVRRAWKLVETSGVVDLVQRWRVEDGLRTNKGGRKRIVSIHVALTLWVLLAMRRKSQHFQEMGRILAFGLTPAMWDMFSLKEIPFDPRSKRQRRKVRKKWSSRVWETLWVVRQTMEPYPEIRLKKRYTVGEWFDLVPGGVLDVDDDEEKKAWREVRKSRGIEFANRLIWASIQLMDPEVFAEWDGTVVVDGTALKVTNRGNPSKKKLTSKDLPLDAFLASTPTAGWHHKDSFSHDGEEFDGDRGKYSWGFELTLSAMSGEGFAKQGGHPGLILGLGFDRPAVNPSARLWESIQNLTERPEIPRGYMIFDRLYPEQKPENLHIPLREEGYGLVFDYKDKKVGFQRELANGAVLIDGRYYSPGIKAFPDLVNPHEEYKATKNREVYLHRLEFRKRFELPHKGTTNAGVERRMCPVRANGTSLACPLVPRSKEGSTAKVQIPLSVKEVPSKERAPKVCRQASITINNTAADGAKFRQDGPAYKTPEWEEVYGQRNTIESRNDKLKNARGVGLGDQTNRLMRGWAGQLLASAVSCVAVNVLLLASDSEWFDHEPDEPKRHTTRYTQDRAYSANTLAGTFPNAPPVAA